jgi:''chromo'' (CHRromatin Organisation MOdifier) domain.
MLEHLQLPFKGMLHPQLKEKVQEALQLPDGAASTKRKQPQQVAAASSSKRQRRSSRQAEPEESEVEDDVDDEESEEETEEDEESDDEEEPVPEKLVDACIKKNGKKDVILFRVKWAGYPDSANTWEPAENLAGYVDMILQFTVARVGQGSWPPTLKYADAKK